VWWNPKKSDASGFSTSWSPDVTTNGARRKPCLRLMSRKELIQSWQQPSEATLDSSPPALLAVSSGRFKRLRVKLHYLSEMGEEILQAVVAGIEMILVCYFLRLQLPVQSLCALAKTEVIAPPAIEVNRHGSQSRAIPARYHQGIIGPPMCRVDRLSEYWTEQIAKRRPGTNCCIEFSRRGGNQCRTLCAD